MASCTGSSTMITNTTRCTHMEEVLASGMVVTTMTKFGDLKQVIDTMATSSLKTFTIETADLLHMEIMHSPGAAQDMTTNSGDSRELEMENSTSSTKDMEVNSTSMEDAVTTE